jgi:Rad3-related DNA helicase
MTDYRSLMFRLWETACADKPQRPSCRVDNGFFVMTLKGNRDNWAAVVQAAGVPAEAEQTIEGDTLTIRWISHADRIFGNGGLMAAELPNYECRLPQLHMARLVQRSIEMGTPAIVEAGTGTGKSFAYAAICLAMGKRLIVSTSNKALQMQLYYKDLPFLQRLFPGKKVVLAVGKSNFACRARCDLLGEVGATIVNPELKEWYTGTDSGNTEEITFAVDRRDIAGIVANDDCSGKHCPYYYDCFYYRAKANYSGADVVITNHALLCLNQLVGGNLLPPADVIVADEAHKLADYARSALGVEFTAKGIERSLSLAEGFAEAAEMAEAEIAASRFQAEIAAYLYGKDTPQIQVSAEDEFKYGLQLADWLGNLAEAVFPEDELPDSAEATANARRADKIRKMADKVRQMATKTAPGFVRWIEPAKREEPLKFCAMPFDVSEFIGKLAGVRNGETAEHKAPDHTRCNRCSRQLTAANVAILEGKPYGPECIKAVDAFGDAEVMPLHEWLQLEHAPKEGEAPRLDGTQPIIFCSATLAAPDMAYFQREAGLPDAMQMIAASPFDYAENAMLYVPAAGNPAPNEAGWLPWAIGEMRSLVLASGGGAFLLFTSYNAMNQAVAELRYTFAARGLNCYVQGELPKMETAKRFREDGNGVLFATKSFFEGVSIDGSALRLVMVDKMPFEAPSPLTAAMEAAATERARQAGVSGRTLEMYAFNNVRVPRMITELKQAAGRLIRTSTDKGVIAVLDPRVRSAQYGRSAVIPALPPAPLISRTESIALFLGTLAPMLTTKPTMAERLAMHVAPVGAKASPVAASFDVVTREDIPF